MPDERKRKDIVITEEDVDLDGYEVVRGEFFAHLYEPSFTFNDNKIYVNTACVRKLPDTDYVQILINPNEKKLAVRPCLESDKDSFKWVSASLKRRSPKQVTCRVFFAKIITLMDWNPRYRYKLLGKLIRSGKELLFIFDLKTPEIFVKTEKEDGTTVSSRTPSYPAQWQHQFGVPVEEHSEAMQINIFDGYTVFSIKDNKKTPEEKNAEDTIPASVEVANGE